MSCGPFYGKYRGTVLNNIDPKMIGRIQVSVADVGGTSLTTWATPCVPVAGIQTGIFTVPIIGSGVWIEFEHGDPDYPIWIGGYWGSAAEVPVLTSLIPPGTAGFAMLTPLGTGIVVSDSGITIKTATNATIVLNAAGITIQNGQGAVISMIGAVVDVNAKALTVI